MQVRGFRKRRSSFARGACVTAAAVVGLSLGVATAPAGATSTPVGPVGYTYVATEGGSFTISGIADVAYGANGKFKRKTDRSGHVDCNNSTFGDPDVHVHKACFTLALVGPAGYSYAATESAHFTVHGLADVAYGASGKFNRKTAATGRIECGNSTFGDPYVHVHKSCYILKLVGPAGYTYAASEGAHITIVGIADVAYGDNGKFLRKTGVTSGIDCTNDVFGNPDSGVQKSCFILSDIGPAGYSYAATEGAHVTITGITDVAYGDRGKFERKTGVTGGIDCTNDVFGNPDNGVQKSCYVLADVGPAGYAYAATEGGHVHISGTANVAYGANGLFNVKAGLKGTISCSNSVFGDPDVHVHKSCYVQPV